MANLELQIGYIGNFGPKQFQMANLELQIGYFGHFRPKQSQMANLVLQIGILYVRKIKLTWSVLTSEITSSL